MKKSLRFLCILTALCLILPGVSPALAGQETADAVFCANIWTGRDDLPSAEAAAVKDGKYIYVGTREGAAAYIGEKTEVNDLGTGFMLPGFIDGHVHCYVSAENARADINLMDGSATTLAEYLDAMKKAARSLTEKDFIRGYGWIDSAFGGQTPSAAMLDEIFPDTPVYIKSEDCHSCWVNTAFLKLTGVTRDTEDPVGGVIERDGNGEPCGCFRDTAMNLYCDPLLPAYSVEEYREMVLDTQTLMLKMGYTAYNDVIIDAGSTDNLCRAYSELDREGLLKIRVDATVICVNDEHYEESVRKVAALADELNGERFKISGIKFFIDGITESKTAYVSVPYENSDSCGADRWPGEEGTKRLYEATRLANDLGLIAHFHAIGDAAVTKALDAIEYAKNNSVNKDIRNAVTHVQMIREEDIPRFRELGAVVSADLGWMPNKTDEDGDSMDFRNLGVERTYDMYLYKSLLRSGATVAYATDYPAGPVLYPLYNLQACICGSIVGFITTVRNWDEMFTVDEALRCITAGGAYQLYLEDRTGLILEGMDADFTVLSGDPHDADPTEIVGSLENLAEHSEVLNYILSPDSSFIFPEGYDGIHVLNTWIGGQPQL